MNYNYPINFSNINLLGFSSPTESFENLCKELIEKEFDTQGSFILGNPSNYPGIEAKPILTKDGKYVAFQAKFIHDDENIYGNLKDSFRNKKNELKIKQEDIDVLDILFIICSCNIKKREQANLEAKLKQEKKTLEVVFLPKKILENILQQDKFAVIRQKYFHNENVERDRQDSNRHDADKSLIVPFIGLTGTPSQEENVLAEKDYKEYQINKLCYIGTDCYSAFNEMEDDILNNIGSTLEGQSRFQPNFSFWSLLYNTKKEIETMIMTSPRGSRIKYFLPKDSHKMGVTLQHHQDKKIKIEIRDSKAIYQINDENEGNDRNG